ncbi:pilus assembly protein Flp/PilA [Gibbsiella quercinecans]|uniref:Pilus assembly protein n=1 Tax=Gibbsiella quercinecans TaxID=929813 RepID=A0A250AZK5_9GAMM|nr:Flp family type IVb pilin [Gibbsiella quercinecans]ATA19265.1 hypothetical protein AWC35_07855 [Gibbsiella quercinecans]RLM11086.1 hypothetical protein BIY30_09055 [Gibbsiella quercinecans]TCT87797.1 pilus assembly protein Flp/PilA [Gibbsiella quercinecans]
MLNTINTKYLATYVSVTESIKRFKLSEKGVTAVEYGIVIAGVAAVVATVFGSGGTVATLLTNIFAKVTTSVTNSMATGTP